jgi:hypothetical protein
MQNLAIPQRHDEQEEEDPVVRVIYALGIALTAVGPMLPNGNKWMILGVGLIAFSTML